MLLIELNGINQDISIPDFAGFPTVDMTFSVWYKKAVAADTTVIAAKINAPNNRTFYFASYADKLQAEVSHDGSASSRSVQDTNAGQYTANTNHRHGLFTYKTSTDTIEIWSEGIKLDSTLVISAPGTGIFDGNAPLVIGSLQGALHFEGLETEIIGWDIVLSDDQALQVYKAGLKGMGDQIAPSNHVFDYRMDDFPEGVVASGADTIKDRSGGNHHGTPSNNPIGRAEEVLSYPGGVVSVIPVPLGNFLPIFQPNNIHSKLFGGQVIQ